MTTEYDAEKYEEELRAAGYTEAQIEKELLYMVRVERENEYFRNNPSRQYTADHGQE